MQNKITFILPTYNRKEYILRAIDSCLACESELIKPYVLVIDGQSDDGAFELMTETYRGRDQVEIIQNKRGTGFQRTAYFGTLQVKTEYATFMYNDDILSPYFKDFFAQMLQSKKDYVMGYGKAYPVDQVFPFKPIETRLTPKNDLIRSYFGDVTALEYYGMPVSPIACITTAAHLKAWVDFSQEFAGKSKMRHYFMVDKNIGPDIIIYLSNILKESETVLLSSNIVAQFSSHADSMSILYGVSPLTVGYWIGRIWAFEKIYEENKNRELIAQCAGYLIISGYNAVAQMIIGRQFKWVLPALGEIFAIKVKVAKKFLVLATIKYAFLTVTSRFRRKSRSDTPD